MALPTNEQIDEAVPPDGTPGRAKTNSLLKLMLAALAVAPQRVPAAPTAADAEGVRGQVYADADYLYFCIGENSWRRIMLSEW